MLGRTSVRVALLANFLSGLAIGTLSYGAMVHLARSGGSQFEVAMVSALYEAFAAMMPGFVGTVTLICFNPTIRARRRSPSPR